MQSELNIQCSLKRETIVNAEILRDRDSVGVAGCGPSPECSREL
jgi:hypothetical protein